MPAHIDADVVDDEVWFVRHKPRRYRIRATADGCRLIAVRKLNGFCLRVDLGDTLPEGLDATSESVAEKLWWSSVFPDADPKLRASAMRRARRNGGVG